MPRFYTAPHLLGVRLPVFIGISGGVAQQLILVAAAGLVYASLTPLDSVWLRKISFIARCTFGASSIAFGLGHLTSVQNVARLVPKWMPLAGDFWVVLTGTAFVLAGIAILSGTLDVPAARLLALMLLVFSILILAPLPFASPHNHVAWGSNAYNLAAVGAAWIFAECIATRRR